jgi:hypothetical protein
MQNDGIVAHCARVENSSRSNCPKNYAFFGQTRLKIGVSSSSDDSNELTLFPNESDSRWRRPNVESLEDLDVLRQDLFRQKSYERWRFRPGREG